MTGRDAWLEKMTEYFPQERQVRMLHCITSSAGWLAAWLLVWLAAQTEVLGKPNVGLTMASTALLVGHSCAEAMHAVVRTLLLAVSADASV